MNGRMDRSKSVNELGKSIEHMISYVIICCHIKSCHIMSHHVVSCRVMVLTLIFLSHHSAIQYIARDSNHQRINQTISVRPDQAQPHRCLGSHEERNRKPFLQQDLPISWRSCEDGDDPESLRCRFGSQGSELELAASRHP